MPTYEYESVVEHTRLKVDSGRGGERGHDEEGKGIIITLFHNRNNNDI